MQGSVSTMTIEEMMESNGSSKVRLADGKKYYVTRDEKGRSVVGPEVKKRFGWLRRKAKQPEAQPMHTTGGSRLANDGDKMQALPSLPPFPAFPNFKVPTFKFPPRPVPPQSWWERQKGIWVARVYDDYWHKAIQHLALDVLTWAFVIFACISLGRVLLWVLSN